MEDRPLFSLPINTESSLHTSLITSRFYPTPKHTWPPIFDSLYINAQHVLLLSRSRSFHYFTPSLCKEGTFNMQGFLNNEKQPLLGTGSTIRLRAVATQDAAAIRSIIEASMEQPSSTDSLDFCPSVAEIENSIKSLQDQPNVLYIVAFDAASGIIYGFVNIIPFTGKPAGPRSCFDRTASIKVVTAGEQSLGSQLALRVQSNLIACAVAACRDKFEGVHTIIADILVPQDQSSQSDNKAQLFLDKGFKLVGTLEGIAEKNNALLDQVFLQLRI